LAYGEREAGLIKPYSALIFDVVLEGIDRPQPEEPTEPEAEDKKAKKSKRGKK
jgi:FKBP-type peptidyl-prolyl cis-trans isomerase FklB